MDQLISLTIKAFICVKVVSAVNFTNDPQEISTEKSRYVYTGRWSVFNDPSLDQSIIPDDEDQREGLRVGLLVTYWTYRKIGSSTLFVGKIDESKLITYYYTHHVNQSEPLLVCQPLQIIGLPMSTLCTTYNKERIDRLDYRGTFKYIWEFEREKFIVDIIVFPLVVILGIFGNSVIILSIIKSKDLKGPTNLFLGSLAVADLLTVTICVPIRFFLAYLQYAIQIGKYGCPIVFGIEGLLFSTSILHLIAIGFERYYAICKPIVTQERCTIARAKRIIVVLWIMAVIFALPIGFEQKSWVIQKGKYGFLYGCAARSRKMEMAVYSCLIVFLWLIPICMLLFTYGSVVVTLIRSMKQASALMEGKSGKKERNNDDPQGRMKVVKMLAAVVVMFFIFWTPRMCYLALIAFYKAALPRVHTNMNTWLQSWAFVNSCVNFFVYAATSKYAHV